MSKINLSAVKFPAFENFIVQTDQRENARKMPYLACSASSRSQEIEETLNNLLRFELARLLKRSSMNKEIVIIKPYRDCLKIPWQRDTFLYFNGVYFPARCVDSNNKFRPEQDAYRLDITGLKPNINKYAYVRKTMIQPELAGFIIGEGGMYFPDQDNNTLFISEAVIGAPGELSWAELKWKIAEIHHIIYGNITAVIIPPPEGIPHIDNHLSVIPKTKLIMLEDEYYKMLYANGVLEALEEIGYTPINIPPSNLECPLNILYLENDTGKIAAYLNPKAPAFVKNLLKINGVEPYELHHAAADYLDTYHGNIRCVTNELPSSDPKLIQRLGMRLVTTL